jgi:putative transposase
MGRIPRNSILYDGCFAHVFSRALDQRFIFQADFEFQYFLTMLLDLKKKYQFKIHHYCLMNTHFHMVVSILNTKAFSEALKLLKSQYTNFYNRNHKRAGTLWRDRFKSMLIEDERYLHACGLYVESNPLKAGLVDRVEAWAYSSARYYYLREKDTLIDPYEQKESPEGIDPMNENLFTKGSFIGSEIFKIQTQEAIGV